MASKKGCYLKTLFPISDAVHFADISTLISIDFGKISGELLSDQRWFSHNFFWKKSG
jgi:hypothetical protein